MKFNLKSTEDEVTFLPRSLLYNLRNRILGSAQRTPVFTSRNYNFAFYSMAEYWIEVGKRNALLNILTDAQTGKANKLRGCTFEEVLVKASIHEFGPLGCGVVLYDIDLQYVGRLQGSLPNTKLSHLKEDVVFISCHDRDRAWTLLERVSPRVAKAVMVDRGIFVASNDSGHNSGLHTDESPAL